MSWQLVIPIGAHHQGEGDEDNPSEYDYDEIDPLEKEWMLASAQADIDGLQRLMMTDSSLLNRKGFLHGYTALHWAAKHGRMDILSMLLLQGATTDIKSVSPHDASYMTHSSLWVGSAGVVVKWLLGDKYVLDQYLKLVSLPSFLHITPYWIFVECLIANAATPVAGIPTFIHPSDCKPRHPHHTTPTIVIYTHVLIPSLSHYPG